MARTNFPDGVNVGQLYLNDSDVSGTIAAGSVAGQASGYKLARGAGTLDASNPTTVATGLTTVVAAIACLKGTAAPGLSTGVLTVNISTTNIDVYAWKATGAGNPTYIASTGTEEFYWIAVGT